MLLNRASFNERFSVICSLSSMTRHRNQNETFFWLRFGQSLPRCFFISSINLKARITWMESIIHSFIGAQWKPVTRFVSAVHQNYLLSQSPFEFSKWPILWYASSLPSLHCTSYSIFFYIKLSKPTKLQEYITTKWN